MKIKEPALKISEEIRAADVLVLSLELIARINQISRT